MANVLRLGLFGLGFSLLSSISVTGHAADACEPSVGRVASYQGSLQVQRTGGGSWQSIGLDEALCEGDAVRAGPRSRAALTLINGAVLRLDQNTTLQLQNVATEAEEQSLFDLVRGALQSFSRRPRLIQVNTPYLNGTIEGTEFALRVVDDRTELTVMEGTVRASNPQGELAVPAGSAAVAVAGRAPEPRTVVNPRDAVQWSLYYPPIQATAGAAGLAGSAELAEAADLLSVGQVAEARSAIDSALLVNPNLGGAYALRAVIGVVQNERDQAIADGEKALALDDSAASSIALSYALQSSFRLEEAREVLRSATSAHPDDALAWARLAELELMLGDRRGAMVSADKAAGIAPELSRTQLVYGFAALAAIQNDAAMAAFTKAVEFDSADPLAHLGLGLTRISEGDLMTGGKDLEVAVSLDSSNSLYRSYLGKAYFEEKRGPLDADQFEIAKQLDPLDPTPYLYDGIRKQTENDPVGALRDIRGSIERNDNRAVYRGRLLLDQDRAARGTSLARVYDNLGFRQLGINEAAQSLAVDPANASAHRFLSDTYPIDSRSEISRVSDLLQSQLLQDININPVQPSLSATNLNIIAQGGPSQAGFNEFTPLFEQNQVQFNFTGFGGSEDTSGLEGVVSGVYDRFSFSAGGFTYDTDGFRDNDDLSHDIYNAYGQFALTEAFNVQAEYGHRETDRGDIAMKFDPDDYDPTFRRSLNSDTWRIGGRITPSQSSNILLSWINTDRHIKGTEKEELFSVPGLGSFDLRTDVKSKDTTNQYEAQYLFQGVGFNAVAGGTYSDVDRKDELTFVVETPFGEDPPFELRDDFTIRDKRAYVYGNIMTGESLTWTVGLSYDDYKEGDVFDFNKTSPKIGLQWNITDGLRLRAAYFKGVKPVLSSNRTLEPTQIAGFSQYFDDANATKFKRYGIGADWELNRNISLGGEFTKRDMDSPVINANTGAGIFEDRDEWNNRLYAYWTPADRWALSAELVYDKFENTRNSQLATDVPEKVKTVSVPLVAQYFHPSGLFASVGATYVDQKVRASDIYRHKTGDSDFTVVNLGVGYRMPKRLGILSLSVQNLFDKDFDYLDNSYRTFQDEPALGPYTPERTVLVSATLSF